MGILEINNRTENWTTARTFAPFFTDKNLRLKLAQRLGEPSATKASEVELELFWKGMRDYFHATGSRGRPTDEKLANCYASLFPDLQAKIKGFSSEDGLTFEDLKAGNYEPSQPRTLRDNLKNTEIDIVIQGKGRIYIGGGERRIWVSRERQFSLGSSASPPVCGDKNPRGTDW